VLFDAVFFPGGAKKARWPQYFTGSISPSSPDRSLRDCVRIGSGRVTQSFLKFTVPSGHIFVFSIEVQEPLLLQNVGRAGLFVGRVGSDRVNLSTYEPFMLEWCKKTRCCGMCCRTGRPTIMKWNSTMCSLLRSLGSALTLELQRGCLPPATIRYTPDHQR